MRFFLYQRLADFCDFSDEVLYDLCKIQCNYVLLRVNFFLPLSILMFPALAPVRPLRCADLVRRQHGFHRLQRVYAFVPRGPGARGQKRSYFSARDPKCSFSRPGKISARPVLLLGELIFGITNDQRTDWGIRPVVIVRRDLTVTAGISRGRKIFK